VIVCVCVCVCVCARVCPARSDRAIAYMAINPNPARHQTNTFVCTHCRTSTTNNTSHARHCPLFVTAGDPPSLVEQKQFDLPCSHSHAQQSFGAKTWKCAHRVNQIALENVYQKHLVYAYALPHASHASTLARTARMHALTVFYTSYITISHVISIFLPDSPPGIF
jgi:hypothetical protein